MNLQLKLTGSGFLNDDSRLIARGLNISYLKGCADQMSYNMDSGSGFGDGRDYGSGGGGSSIWKDDYPFELILF